MQGRHMTFDTLIGRLQRLRNLAEVVDADDYAETVRDILDELEPPLNRDATDVDPALLNSLQRRIAERSKPKI